MKKIIFILLILIASVLYAMKTFLYYSPSEINILNDIIALPIMLMIMNYIMLFIYRNKFKMNLGFILLTFLTISVLFEGIFPFLSKNSTADLMDIIWYFIGSILYWGFEKGIKSREGILI